MESILKEPSISDNRKVQKENNMRRAEVEYLRFLRTKEKPENFSTLKIIGKGAFGEVKLVQRRNDGKIYALKSLVKQEMVRCPPDYQERSILTCNSLKKTSWPTYGQNVTFLPRQTAHGLSSCTQPSRTPPSFTCSWNSYLVVIL
jgi:serine/threonine protein kinase